METILRTEKWKFINRKWLSFWVGDYGRGVPAEELGLITNNFYRGKDIKDTDIQGSGLGLYISSMLIGKMNGELICSSRGEGLTVTLMILLS